MNNKNFASHFIDVTIPYRRSKSNTNITNKINKKNESCKVVQKTPTFKEKVNSTQHNN